MLFSVVRLETLRLSRPVSIKIEPPGRVLIGFYEKYYIKEYMMEYFIIENNGQQAGPFSLEQLVQNCLLYTSILAK